MYGTHPHPHYGEWANSGHPVFRATSALERGELKSKTIELILRTIISVNQLRMYGAVADLSKELARDSSSAGKPAAKENLESMVIPTELPIADPISHTDAEYKETCCENTKTLSQCWFLEEHQNQFVSVRFCEILAYAILVWPTRQEFHRADECLDQVGMLFLSDLSRQKCTKFTGQQGSTFQIHQRVTEKRERIFADNKHRMRCHQMCRTREQEFALLSECAVQTRSIALLPEWAEYRTSPSARITRRHVSWLEQTRISHGEGHHITSCEVTLDEVTLDEDRQTRTSHGSRSRDDQHTTMRDVTPDGEI